jgi:hypothetical protein
MGKAYQNQKKTAKPKRETNALASQKFKPIKQKADSYTK